MARYALSRQQGRCKHTLSQQSPHFGGGVGGAEVLRGTMLLLLAAACSEEPETKATPAPELAAIRVPELVVNSPARGAFLGDVDQVNVAGTTKVGSAPLTTMEVNGKSIDIESKGGKFDGNVPVIPGVNLLGGRLEASDSGRAVDGRAVMAGAVWEPAERLSDTIKLQLGPEALDDNKPDMDDLASIAETVLSNPSLLESFVGYEIPTEYYTLTLTGAELGDSAIDIESGDGELALDVVVSDLIMDFDVEGAGIFSWVSTTGQAGADSATLNITLELSADDGDVVAVPTGIDVALTGFWVTVDWFPDSLEDDLAGWTQATLEETVAETVSEQVQTLVGEYLSAFSTNVEFGDFLLNVSLASLRCAEDGLRLTLDAWVDFPVQLDLPRNAGSLRTDGDGPSFPLTTTEPFAAAADDDLVHQLLFAFWAGGSLSGISFDALTLQALAGEIPPPIGPVERVEIDVHLPVTTGKPSYEDQSIDISIGEMRLVVYREDGEVIDASVNVRTGALVYLDEENELNFTLDARPSFMTLEVGMEKSPQGLDPGDMAALVRLTVPGLFDAIGGFVPDVPVPDIPLESFSDSLRGQALGLADPTVRVDDGWVVIEGSLAEK